MISYEKVRQSLRSWTLIIGWLNVVAGLFKIFSLVSYYFLINNLDSLKDNYDPETYKAIVASTHIGNFLLIIIGLGANITISYLAFKNLPKIQENHPSQLPHLIALVYTFLVNLISIVLNISLGITLSIYSFLTPLVMLGLYGFIYYQADRLLKKENQEE